MLQMDTVTDSSLDINVVCSDRRLTGHPVGNPDCPDQFAFTSIIRQLSTFPRDRVAPGEWDVDAACSFFQHRDDSSNSSSRPINYEKNTLLDIIHSRPTETDNVRLNRDVTSSDLADCCSCNIELTTDRKFTDSLIQHLSCTEQNLFDCVLRPSSSSETFQCSRQTVGLNPQLNSSSSSSFSSIDFDSRRSPMFQSRGRHSSADDVSCNCFRRKSTTPICRRFGVAASLSWLPLLWILIAASCLSRRADGLPIASPAAAAPDVKVFDGNPTDLGVDGTSYLMKFGYLPSSDMETGALRSDEELHRAVRHFQRIAGVRQTGRLDPETLAVMKRPRCGMADMLEVGRWTPDDPPASVTETGTASGTGTESKHRHGHGQDWSRYGRPQEYTFGPSKWEKMQLTYRILNFTPDLRYMETRQAIAQAFSVWSDVSQLTFQEVQSGSADILIEFASGYHHDGYPFDGPGLVLAHAFFPGEDRGGDVHFDEDEPWTVNVDSGINLFMVAAHEIGHALGLAHSTVPGSLMYPWHQGYDPMFTLPYDDTVAIQLLYGSNTRPNIPSTTTVRPRPSYPRYPVVPTRPPRRPTWYQPTTTTRPPPPPRTTRPTTSRPVPTHRTPVRIPPRSEPPPSQCAATFDAVALIRGDVFAFKGKWFWRMTDDGAMVEGHPVEIARFWFGLPPDLDHIDAVFERTGDGHIVFFSGAQYWEFSGTERYSVSGRPLTDLGLPLDIDRIDAAFVWGHNRRTYLISGSMYWKLDEHSRKVEMHTYPRDMSMWAGVPVPVDSAFTHSDGKTYFFKEKNYFEFSNARMHTQRGYPQPIAKRWLNCTTVGNTGSDFPTVVDGFQQDDPTGKASAFSASSCARIFAVAIFIVVFVRRRS